MSDRNPLSGRRGVWLQQLSATGEETFAGVLETMKKYGFGCLCMKVGEGLSWVGTWDPTTPIRSLAEMQAVQGQCAEAGVTFCPVIVPRGINIEAEAGFAADIATAAGSVMLDVEPYPNYFSEPARVPEYLAKVREFAAPGAFIILEPDPRPGAWTAYSREAVGALVDAVSSQHYVGSDAGWMNVTLEVERLELDLASFKELCPTLYGLGDLGPPAAFWNAVRGVCSGFTTFAFGQMNADQLAAMGALPMEQQPPVPGPVFEDTRLREALTWRLGNASRLLRELADALDPSTPVPAGVYWNSVSGLVGAPGGGSSPRMGGTYPQVGVPVTVTAPAALAQAADTAIDFEETVANIFVQNNAETPVGFQLDGNAATAGSPLLTKGQTLLLPVNLKTLHCYTVAAATPINGTAAGNLVVMGWL